MTTRFAPRRRARGEEGQGGIDNEPWFVLADLCRVLDIANPSNVVARLDPSLADTLRLTEGENARGQMRRLRARVGLAVPADNYAVGLRW